MTILVQSSYAAAQIGSQPSTYTWWLKDLTDYDNSIPLFVDGSSGVTLASDVDQAAFTPMGEPDYVVVSDVAKSDKLSFTAQMFESDYDIFEAIRKSLTVVLIQTDYGRQWYSKLDTRSTQLINTEGGYCLVAINTYTVSRPPA